MYDSITGGFVSISEIVSGGIEVQVRHEVVLLQILERPVHRQLDVRICHHRNDARFSRGGHGVVIPRDVLGKCLVRDRQHPRMARDERRRRLQCLHQARVDGGERQWLAFDERRRTVVQQRVESARRLAEGRPLRRVRSTASDDVAAPIVSGRTKPSLGGSVSMASGVSASG